MVSVTMLGILVLQWIKQSEREARRIDRQLDREEAQQVQQAQQAQQGGAAPVHGRSPDAPVG
jgi:heme exporter protein D